ncbi:lysozyme inhibitor LprI family protein [Virgibacillus siamensis]|uniref:lysozyme inhibitor LprI family protein n=1 Tax=Virgibacillus siamensis TaxID=480071 RepID=UPI001FE759FE|nr:lysozyme inhibitor LprI family protein [Virgibacillus siamensis]
MKNNRNVLMVIAILVILAACESTDKQTTTISSDAGIKSESKNIEISEANESKEQGQVVTEKNDKNPSESGENIQIVGGEEAVQYLKQQLKEGSNDDVSFGTDGKLETDNIGSYYTIQLVNIPLRVSGKTGNLGYYKVYQNGTYEPYQLKSHGSNSEIAGYSQEEYLKKLKDIEKEMEDLRKNSEATTTLDMKEEEVYIYKIWDVELNEIYDALKEYLDKEQMDKLRVEQRNWIKHRDEAAKKASQKYKGGSMESLEYVAAQTTLTRERCYGLVAKYMK